MTTESGLVRVKYKIKKSQNPLFEKWLKEWKEEAVKNGSEMRHTFNRALKSLQKFPVKLYSGKDCIILENFGTKICKMLDDKLEAYKALHPEDHSLHVENVSGKRASETQHVDTDLVILNVESEIGKRKSDQGLPSKKKKIAPETKPGFSSIKSSNYVPAFGSGAHVILVTLYDKMQEDNQGNLSQFEIETFSCAFCESLSINPFPVWSSIGVLIRKNLVTKKGIPPKFQLTEDGIDLALKLKKRDADKVEASSESPTEDTNVKTSDKPFCDKHNIGEVYDNSRKTVSSQEKESENDQEEEREEETIFMEPGTFEIILMVDNQERDDKFQQGSKMNVRTLNSRHVNFEMRHLKVGDFLWVARDFSGRELVLPYIVERKRMDDLGSSIKDGRFHEQKFRLKQSGVENLIYLVEKYGNENQRLGLPLPTLFQAISNTQILGGFTVKLTNSHDHSMKYLECLTTRLDQLFKTKMLMSCKKQNLSPLNLSDDPIPLMTFKEFNKGSEKNKKPTVRKMLVKHLLQLNGVSVEKAKAIVELYPTPKALAEGLKQPSGEKSIADLTFGGFRRAIGPVTARQLHLLYTSLDLR